METPLENAPGPNLHEPPGAPVALADLAVPKAAELAALAASGALPHVRFIECRREGADEVVVLDIEPEVPQRPTYDIRPVERVAVYFDAYDRAAPTPLALRRDFPLTPHQFSSPDGAPRSLCLYEASYDDLKPTWTAAGLARQLHCWLSKTAVGVLHGTTQPLEPLFFNALERIVLPPAFFERGDADGGEVPLPEHLVIYEAATTRGRRTLVASEATCAPAPHLRPIHLVAFAHDAKPRVHGVMRLPPTTLDALHAYLAETGEDLLGRLRARLGDLPDADLRHQLLILLRTPLRRHEGGPIEAVEVRAFITDPIAIVVGDAVGLWTAHEGGRGHLIPPDLTKRGEGVRLHLLNSMPALARAGAATYNGFDGPADLHYVAVGAGALGSQVLNNLYRAGHGRWTLVDEDQLLPHNVARHLLSTPDVGFPKAERVAAALNPTFAEPAITPIVADVLVERPPALEAAYKEADVLLDLSASVAVARHLALDVEADARRVSLFLNPDGTDLVLLAEPADRALRLDHLEMEYYRALARSPYLADHLVRPGQPVRYAHACRDVSSEIPQDLVGLHAAIGARAVRRVTSAEDAAVGVWRASDHLAVGLVRVEPAPYTEGTAGGWSLSVSERLLAALTHQRHGRLPNETGGVLVGAFDTLRRRIYVVDHIPSPPDSQEWPTAYIRGAFGLEEALDETGARTAGQLVYAGEWHSHPAGARLDPSDDDRALFGWLSDHRHLDGLPPLIAIAGDGAVAWYVGTLEDRLVTPLPGP